MALLTKIAQLPTSPLPIRLGALEFSSPLLLAPLAGITCPPFRYLMQLLGAGGTCSELISAHGILHGNVKTRQMLTILPQEQRVGIQIFGENPELLAAAAEIVQEYRPSYIDINMGCPVHKVVSKGAGAALLENPCQLGPFFQKIKKRINLPLTVKIRTGTTLETRNADRIAQVAKDAGLEFVAIHGRTKVQQYQGEADWDYLEKVAKTSPLPIIGNGDLHHQEAVYSRLRQTACRALMLGRGPLRYPFLFLEGRSPANTYHFTAQDYFQVVVLFRQLLENFYSTERVMLLQLKKHVAWWSAGHAHSIRFRQEIFASGSIPEIIQRSDEFFGNLPPNTTVTSLPFTSGHG